MFEGLKGEQSTNNKKSCKKGVKKIIDRKEELPKKSSIDTDNCGDKYTKLIHKRTTTKNNFLSFKIFFFV